MAGLGVVHVMMRSADEIRGVLTRLDWNVRRHMAFLARQVSPWAWLVLAMIVASLLMCAMVYRQVAHIKKLELDLAAHSSSIARTSALASTVPKLHDGQVQLRLFDAQLLTPEDIPAVVQLLLRLAQEEGLRADRGSYRTEIDGVGGFLRYRMNIPLRGSAVAVQKFLKAALQQNKTMALKSLQFHRDRIEAAEIDARIELVLFTRLPEKKSATRGSP